MATTSENLNTVQLRQRIITKEEIIRLLTERIEDLKAEISGMHEEIKQLEKQNEM